MRRLIHRERSKTMKIIMTLYYHPKNPDSKKACKLLQKNKCDFSSLNVTMNGISSYLYKDTGISELPAIHVISDEGERTYEGIEAIETLVKSMR